MRKDEKKYITAAAISGSDIRQLRKQLQMTQHEFASFAGIPVPTVSRWEQSGKALHGPILLLYEILTRYPEYANRFAVPERTYPLRLWYMHNKTVCTIIDADLLNRHVRVKNYHPNVLFCAFGTDKEPSFETFEAFLESRCFPQGRDKMKLMLKELDIPFYDPLLIIEKTEGRMEEDDFWIRLERQ